VRLQPYSINPYFIHLFLAKVLLNNKGKETDLKELLTSLDHKVYFPADLSMALDMVEDGHTYAENATQKAVAFTQISGLITLSDDSGLEVDALDSQTGLYSQRFCPNPNATDSECRKYLLEQM
jgi:XTP/dITP diphosphohydrolase